MTTKFRKNGLQYKAVDLLFTPSNNICIYARQCLSTWLVALAGIGCIASIVYMIHAIRNEVKIETFWDIAMIFPGMATISVALTVVGFVAISLIGQGIISLVGLIYKPVKTAHKNSVATEYVKAKMDRICKRIEFIDDNNSGV